MCISKEGGDFFIPEAGNTTANASDKKRQFGMLLCKLNELIYIRANGLHPTLHRRDAVATPLQSYALSHDGSKLAVSQVSGSTAMHSFKITTEHEYFARLKFCDILWCCSHRFIVLTPQR